MTNRNNCFNQTDDKVASLSLGTITSDFHLLQVRLLVPVIVGTGFFQARPDAVPGIKVLKHQH